MRTRLGIDYGAMNGIHLGGDNTSGTTEAEICWNCHKDVDGANTYGVSEWGFNTKTTPAGYPVVLNTAPANFPTQHDGTADRVSNGWIWNSSYASKVTDWTAGYWSNEYDINIKSRITSVHTASFIPGDNNQSSSVAANFKPSDNTVERNSPILEHNSSIRCSYCHDVHDRNKAQSDTRSGKPFLRGSWVGDPYPPELPPRAAGTMMHGVPYSYYGGLPRSRSYNRERGGYFIDQNSGWPTDSPAMNTLSSTAGLCTLCHDTNVDTMDFYPGSTLWRTGMVNGHSNSTLGGTRSNARDIFSGVRRNPDGTPAWDMGNQTHVGTSLYPLGARYRACVPTGYCCQITNAGWYGGVNPPLIDQCAGYDGDYANWYGDMTIGGAKGPGSMAHKFTCSKCHSPHAAGLPALLVHNCVDAVVGNGVGSMNTDAFNCHRKTSAADGWHKLAPGQ